MNSSQNKVVMLLSNPFEPDVRVHREAKSLVRNGISVTILCWDREKKYPKSEVIDKIAVRRIQSKGRYGFGMSSAFDFCYYYLRILMLLFSMDVDVVHCHDLDTLPVGFLFSKVKGKKICYDAHEPLYFTNFPKIAQKATNKMEQLISLRADKIFITSQIQMKKFLLLGNNQDFIIELKNCPPFDFFPPFNEKLETGKIVIGYVGYIREGVGVDRMVRLFDVLCEKYDNLELLLVGKIHQRYQRYFSDLLSATKHLRKIKITGLLPIEEVMKYYRQIDISLILYEDIPLVKYNNPIKLFESMANGIPVVITRVGDAEKIISDLQCGFLVDNDEEADIIKKLEYLIENPQERYQMGLRGYEAAKKYFNWETMEKRLLSAYKQILNHQS